MNDVTNIDIQAEDRNPFEVINEMVEDAKLPEFYADKAEREIEGITEIAQDEYLIRKANIAYLTDIGRTDMVDDLSRYAKADVENCARLTLGRAKECPQHLPCVGPPSTKFISDVIEYEVELDTKDGKMVGVSCQMIRDHLKFRLQFQFNFVVVEFNVKFEDGTTDGRTYVYEPKDDILRTITDDEVARLNGEKVVLGG